MENKLICGDKFIYGDDTILLPISLNLPSKINFEGDTFVINTFLHVSLVCIEKIIEKYNVSLLDFENKIINDFCEFIQKNEIKKVNYTNDFKIAFKRDKKTIVVMCDVPNLNKFFDLINKKYGLNIEYPPLHVTLYTLPGKLGIFLTNSDDIQKLTKSIPNPLNQTL
ncbi:MAG: hypothetical protein WC603_00575 [Candidatus Paceibacterota bacterium]|jgi:hypothetical protein